ncbi:MAG: ferritin [bacterium]
MMISKKMAKAINEQVTNEFNAYWIYQQMAFSFETMGFKVFSQWFVAQATEERGHAEKMAKYLLDQGADVQLLSLAKPQAEFKTVADVIQGALDHELKVTKQINALMDIAVTEKDHASAQFLQWFVQEQVEEVATAKELLDLVKKAKTDDQILLLESRIMALRGPAGPKA